MSRIIRSSDLDDFGPVIKMVFQLSFPNGLTMQELKESDKGWLNAIYDRLKDGDSV